MGAAILNAEALFAFIEAHRDDAFVWGKSDCVTFAAGAYDAAHGTAFRKLATGYKNEAAAKQKLGKAGLAGALKKAGFVKGEPAFAGRGDMCIVRVAGAPALAVCLGETLAAQGAHGVTFLPRSDMVQACRRS